MGTIYNLIVYKIKSCICYGHQAGMEQTYKKLKWYLQADVSARVHIENKKEVRNYDVTIKIHYIFFSQVNYHF